MIGMAVAGALLLVSNISVDYVQVSLSQLSKSPKSFEGKKVEVSGTLRNTGRAYFKGAKFELQEDGQSIRVQSWLPLEVPPPRPGTDGVVARRSVMSDFLGKKVRLKGEWRAGKAEDQPGWILDGHSAEVVEVTPNPE